MNDVEITITVLCTVPVALVLLALLLRSGRKRREAAAARLTMLQDALRHPALDEATRAELTRVLADDYHRTHAPLGQRCSRWLRVGYVLLLAAGWLLLVGGAGFWAAGEMLGLSTRSIQPAIASTIVGAALVSLPLALCELLRRGERAASPAER